MVSNFYLIVSFSLFGFGQLLSLCDIEGSTLVVHDVVNQAPINDQSKVMENPISCIENVIGIQNTGNDKEKVLENLIDNEQAPINIAAAQKASFVDEATKIFIKWNKCQHCSQIVIFLSTDVNTSMITTIRTF